jgi:1,2-diacylglycerol 3-beta-galactosyltransferase
LNSEPRSLELIFFDAGGGHRNAAFALKEVMAERYPHWCVDLVNLQEILEPVDLYYRVTGHPSQSFYNALLKRGWTLGSLQMLRALQKGIQLYSETIEEELRLHWQTAQPDLVVSMIPNFNGVMFRALRQVHPDTPYVTVMTDLADCPPHFWQEKQDQFIVCGTDMAARQARAAGYPPEHILQTSGMILKPGFYRQSHADRRLERQKLGLDPDLPTALIMFGGYGAATAAKIVDRLDRAGLRLQTIVLCGHNDKLRTALADRKSCLAIGYTNAVAEYMRLADFFIGKPGPGSLTEGLHLGLPAIVECNMRTMPQERYNTEWLVERQLGIVIKDFRRIAEAVEELLSDDRLQQFRRNAARLDNRAVYEIPAMLERIMASKGGEDAPAPHEDRALGSALEDLVSR